MKKISAVIFCLLFHHFASAQSPIIKEVKIEFERTLNQWADLPGNFADQIRNSMPQYTSRFFTFESDGRKSLYKPVPQKTEQTERRGFMRAMIPENTVFTNFEQQQQVSLKSLFEKSYLITDSLRNADWKFTNDFREIAGFNCRRVTTIIMDSVFVVAFYTDEIMIPGGPESFTGLPGMIMGLVINRLHTTWYATKVSVVDVEPARIALPDSGKAEKISRNKLKTTISNLMSGFGRRNDSLVWWAMI